MRDRQSCLAARGALTAAGLAWLVAASAAAAQAPVATEAAALRREPITVELEGGSKVAAEQGTLRVPASRERADGRAFELHFVRVPGAVAGGGVPTLYLPGGPGGSATDLLRAPHAAAVIAALDPIGDLILLDQRGTGRSRPVPSCGEPTPLSPATAFRDREAMLERSLRAVAACAAEWRAQGVEPADFNSREAADDIDALRRALGIERVNLLGFSYGTHLALTVMRRHPHAVARAVLIGTEGPDHTLKLPSTYDQQLAKLARLAAEDPAVGALVPDLVVLLRRVLGELAERPVTVTVHDRKGQQVAVPVGPWGLLRILRWDVGDGNDFVAFPALLHGIAQGDPAILARYVEKRWNQLGRGVGLMPLATDCASGASPARRSRIAAEEPGSLLGEVTNYPLPQICAALGAIDLGAEHRAPLSSDVPTLLVSGTLDSNTPPHQAEEVRWGFTRSVHLVVEHAGHEDTLPHPEVQRAIYDHLAGRDVSGRHVTLPRPRFLTPEQARGRRP